MTVDPCSVEKVASSSNVQHRFTWSGQSFFMPCLADVPSQEFVEEGGKYLKINIFFLAFLYFTRKCTPDTSEEE